MRISDTILGQRATELALKFDARVEATPDANGVGSTTGELRKVIGDMRGVFFADDVEAFIATLPLDAKQALSPAKNEAPAAEGSIFQTYNAKRAALMDMERSISRKLPDLQRALRDGLMVYGRAYTDGPQQWLWSKDSAHLDMMQGYTDRETFQNSYGLIFRVKDPKADLFETRARKTVSEVNRLLKAAFPEILESSLVAGPYKEGPGKVTVRSAIHWADAELKDPKAEAAQSLRAVIRAATPGYADLSRDVTQLEGELKKKGIAGEEAVRESKDRYANMSAQDLYQEIMSVIYDVTGVDGSSGLVDSSTIKKEHAESSGTISGSSSTSSSAWYGRSSGSGHFSGSISLENEIINPLARAHTFYLDPLPEQLDIPNAGASPSRLDEKVLAKHNLVSNAMVAIAADRLLSARRMYEYLVVNHSSSKETGALREWMEHSEFTVVRPTSEFTRLYSQDRGEDRVLATFDMSNIRRQILELAGTELYPGENTALIKREIESGLARPLGRIFSAVRAL